MDAALLADAANDLTRAAAEYEETLRVTSARFTQRFAAAMAVRRLGPIYEELGQIDDALNAYERLAAWWADADVDRQQVVRDARARMAALRSESRSD